MEKLVNTLEQLLDDYHKVDPEDYAIVDNPPIYTEDLPTPIAQSILGETYDSNMIYKLINSEDKTVVATFSKTGDLVDELTLETSSDVLSLGELRDSIALRSDLPEHEYQGRDPYEKVGKGKGIILPIIIFSVLALVGVALFAFIKMFLM